MHARTRKRVYAYIREKSCSVYDYAVEKYGSRVPKDKKVDTDAYDEQTAKVDFVGDMMREKESFPAFDDYDMIRGYLIRRRACTEARRAFRELWKEYLCEKA